MLSPHFGCKHSNFTRHHTKLESILSLRMKKSFPERKLLSSLPLIFQWPVYLLINWTHQTVKPMKTLGLLWSHAKLFPKIAKGTSFFPINFRKNGENKYMGYKVKNNYLYYPRRLPWKMCVALVLFYELNFTNTKSQRKPDLPTQPHQHQAWIVSLHC